MKYCLKLFDKHLWQNSPAANLQHKLTNAKHFVSSNFQELKIIPENNFPKFPEWLHILDKYIVSLSSLMFLNSVCHRSNTIGFIALSTWGDLQSQIFIN